MKCDMTVPLQVNFLSPPPLGFPSSQLVTTRVKEILEALEHEHTAQNHGAHLVIKQFTTHKKKPAPQAPTIPRILQGYSMARIFSFHRQDEQKDTYPVPVFVAAPHLVVEDQLYLIELYEHYINRLYPLYSMDTLKEALYNDMSTPDCSPLLLYALFLRTAPFSKEKRIQVLAAPLLAYCSQLVPAYIDRPRLSTIVALLLLTEYLEHTLLAHQLTRAWTWMGMALRMVQDMGLHRQSASSPQLSIRVFWAAFVKDRLMSMIYGRPFMLDEKDM
ncbi:fungal-specific transcription factor domain-containing protein [Spinellus fusiger]|nr:fungal-specific transcription factor domain-containing protein [Spinellus fusiger]